MSALTYSKKKSGGVQLSANFKVAEFACHDGSDTVLISGELVALLQKIRDHFGKPVTVNSAYRTAAWNAKQGGAPKSQHLRGMAADITIAGVSPLAIAQYAEFLQPGAGGIGVYQSFAHVDVRAVNKLVAAGIIDSPDRWKSGEWSTRAVELLIIKMAGKV